MGLARVKDYLSPVFLQHGYTQPVTTRPRSLQSLIILLLITTSLAPTWPPDPPDPRFGAVESYMAPKEAGALRVGWDRMVIRWDARQPNGPDEWKIPKGEPERVVTAELAGREMAALIMGTPRWATDGLPIGGMPRGIDLPFNDPGNLWAAFVRRIVGEYKGKIKHWIIWNEPDIALQDTGAQFAGSVEDYYKLLKVAYLAAKEANPEAVIHLAGLTYWHDVVNNRPLYLRRLLDVAKSDPSAPANNYYFDVATAHIYFKTDDVYNIITLYRGVLDEYGLHQPIWLNETNAPPVNDPQYPVDKPPLFPVTMEEQAAFVIQANALALAAGADRIAIYKLYDEIPITALPGGDPYSYGLIRPDHSPRPALDALRVVTTHFSAAKKVTRVAKPDHYTVRLDRGGAITRVVWARTDQPVALKLRPAPDAISATLYDVSGEAVALTTDSNGNYRLTLPPAFCLPNDGCLIGGSPLVLVEIGPFGDK